MADTFRKFASRVSGVSGSAWAFIAATALIVGWGASGPLFAFSETWQLVINTTTTIVTFLMVFLIQNAQNRDAQAIHLKLDELLRATEAARTGLVDVEHLSDEALQRLQADFARLREQAGDVVELAQAEREERREAAAS